MASGDVVTDRADIDNCVGAAVLGPLYLHTAGLCLVALLSAQETEARRGAVVVVASSDAEVTAICDDIVTLR
jgi:hypothetical protein